jgi:hypothetical protein
VTGHKTEISIVRTFSGIAAAAAGAMLLIGGAPVQAQGLVRNAQTVALKSGETQVLGHLYWVAQCRSILKGTPEVEIIDGPPGLVAEVKEEMVLPRAQNCPKKVAGGLLSVSAKDVDDPSTSQVTLRITYRTKDGDRHRAWLINVALLP